MSNLAVGFSNENQSSFWTRKERNSPFDTKGSELIAGDDLVNPIYEIKWSNRVPTDAPPATAYVEKEGKEEKPLDFGTWGLGNIMEMYRTANPGMTVRPRPWPRRVASSTELESIQWHSRRGLSFVQNPQTTFWNFQKNARLEGAIATRLKGEEQMEWRFNRMNFGRVEYAPWSIEGPVLLELKSILLEIPLCPASS